MSMILSIYLILFISVVVSLSIILIKFIRLQRMPLHVRWELYPTPKYQTQVMLPEIFFLKGLWEHNRILWWRSYPFHLSLYLLTAYFLFLGLGFLTLAKVLLFIAVPLGLWGSGALFVLRKTDPQQSQYSSPADFFNLVLFFAYFLLLTVSFFKIDLVLVQSHQLIHNLFTFSWQGGIPFLIKLQLSITALLMVYVPLTHMSHFFTKWFTYHKVRWDDEEMTSGSHLEKQIDRQLQYKPSWSASHIAGNKDKTWLDIAVEEVVYEKK